MKKNYIGLFSIIITGLLLTISCDKKVGKMPTEETTTTTGGPVNTCDTITYTKHIKAWVNENCLACHTSTNQQGGVTFDTYALFKAKANEGRIKDRVLEGKPSFMPKDLAGNPIELPKAKKDLIACWLNSGMKE